jgi:ElaB/YqjD/DUF883 family membrane-anchored ribosome-binding protein
MKTNAKTSAQTPKEILNDLHALVAEAEKMMGENLSEATEDAVSSLRSRFDAAQERMSELYERRPQAGDRRRQVHRHGPSVPILTNRWPWPRASVS